MIIMKIIQTHAKVIKNFQKKNIYNIVMYTNY